MVFYDHSTGSSSVCIRCIFWFNVGLVLQAGFSAIFSHSEKGRKPRQTSWKHGSFLRWTKSICNNFLQFGASQGKGWNPSHIGVLCFLVGMILPWDAPSPSIATFNCGLICNILIQIEEFRPGPGERDFSVTPDSRVTLA